MLGYAEGGRQGFTFGSICALHLLNFSKKLQLSLENILGNKLLLIAKTYASHTS
jgi:hypothetical protein